MFLDFVDFVNANPILIIVGLVGHIVYDYIQSRNNRKFRDTMYTRTSQQNTDHQVLVTEVNGLKEDVKEIKENINIGLAEHIREKK